MDIKRMLAVIFILTVLCCTQNETRKTDRSVRTDHLSFSHIILDFKGAPENKADRDMLMFSDQGAWFSYGLPDSLTAYGGFSGPFLMTQENGVWISPNLSRLQLSDGSNNGKIIDWGERFGASEEFGQAIWNSTLKTTI